MSASGQAANGTWTGRRVLAWLRAKSSDRNVKGMARYGIQASKVFGVSMGTMKPLAKRIGRDHTLALALWKSGWYEARLLAALVDDPREVTSSQMDAWAKDFENWADCDTACFQLFDRTPHAFPKAVEWSRHKEEFVKRAGFALMAGLALHDRSSPDSKFTPFFVRIRAGARDDRNFVKKGVSWALRSIGSRSAGLHRRSMVLAQSLAGSTTPSSRWVGSDAVRDLSRPIVAARIRRRAERS